MFNRNQEDPVIMKKVDQIPNNYLSKAYGELDTGSSCSLKDLKTLLFSYVAYSASENIPQVVNIREMNIF